MLSFANFLRAVCCLVFFQHTYAWAKDNAELDDVIKKHRASRELIQSSHCMVDMTFKTHREGKTVEENIHSEHWFDCGKYRFEGPEGSGKIVYVWQDSVRRYLTVHPNNNKLVAAGIIATSSPHGNRADPWPHALFAVTLPSSPDAVPFESLFHRGAIFDKIWEEYIDTHRYVVVRVRYRPKPDREEFTLDIRFDPHANYLIQKVIRSGEGYVREDEVLSFQELKPGIFFPLTMAGKGGSSATTITSNTCRMSKVELNIPLKDSIFKLRYPNGISIVDNVQNTIYKVDSEGVPISKPEPILKPKNYPPAPQEKRIEVVQTSATEIEPVSNTAFWFKILAAIFLLLGIIVVYRRRRLSTK